MKTVTNTTKKPTKKAAPKPGTVAHNSLRIAELENNTGEANKAEFETLKAAIVELENRPAEPQDCQQCKVATLAAIPEKYMATGRVTLPALGGLALPKGVGFHAYVDVEFEDVIDGDGVPYTPRRETIEEKLKALADKLHPGHLGVVLCNVSVLPTGW